MQAIHAALRLSRALRHEQHKPGGAAAVFGFPYLDTLKMCGRKELSDGVEVRNGGGGGWGGQGRGDTNGRLSLSPSNS